MGPSGYYLGQTFDVYFVVDLNDPSDAIWGSYSGPKTLYWGFNYAGGGLWYEAGEDFGEDLFGSSGVKYQGLTPPVEVPAFSGDLIATPKQMDENFKKSIQQFDATEAEFGDEDG